MIISLLLHRNFGSIVYDIVQKYENFEVFQLRKLEKLSIKIGKAELDIKVLRNCKLFNFIPRFLGFDLPHTNEVDSKFVCKRLLRKSRRTKKVRKRLWKNFTEFNCKILIRRSIYIEKNVLGMILEKQLKRYFSTGEEIQKFDEK